MILTELLIVFASAGAVVFVFHRLRVPAVVGLLVAGVAVGPHALGWVRNTEDVHLLSEIGVVVLLFTVGLEFSLSRVLAMSRLMARVGLPQLVLSVAAAALLTAPAVGGLNRAVFAGMLVAMSSTAVVLKVLADRGELHAPYGRVSVAVLLFQDLLVAAFVLAVPLLAPDPPAGRSPWLSLPVGLATVAGILLAGKHLLPRVLYQVVRTRNRELFLIAIFLVCIGTAR